MKRIRFTKSLLIILVAEFLLGSCTIVKKKKEKNIIGTWEVINVWNPSDSILINWVFDVEGNCFLLHMTDSGNTILDQGQWSITQKLNGAFVNTVFEGIYAGAFDLNNLWLIQKLNKEVMILNFQKGGIITIEFKRT